MPRTAPFDKHAVAYDEWFERNPLAYQSELAALRAVMPEHTCALEVGVGTGRFAGPLGIRLGIEPSSAMAGLATSRGVRVVLGVGERLPFKGRACDLVLMVTTLCFLDDVAAALREVWRVLVPDGHLVIGLIDRNSELAAVYEQKKSRGRFYSIAEFRSSAEVLADLESVGFRDLVAVQTIFEPPEALRTVSRLQPGTGRGLFAVVRGRR